MSSVPTVTLTKKELESKWKDLLGATLEAWAHMILFVRQVYPAESFCSPPTTLFGLRLHHNRHPAVAAYIAEAVKVALPSLTSRVADSITLTIIETNPPLLLPADDQQPPPRYDWLSQAHLEMTDVNDNDDEEEEGNRLGQQSQDYHQRHHQQQEEEKEIIQPEPLVLEKFELRFPHGPQEEGHQHNGIHSDSRRPSVYTLSAVDYLEREMRAILLSVYAMKDTNDEHGDSSAPSESESLSFTISLHVPEANASCEALDRAMATGEWRTPPAIVPNHPNTTTTKYSGPRTTIDHPKTPYVMRPLHTMDALTSPVGPVQFVVKYPRPVGQRLSRRGGHKRHRRSRHDSPDSSGTQSTPTLDF
jgi:hypothetical protein